MDDFRFDEEGARRRLAYQPSMQAPALYGLLIRLGLVRDERQAKLLLICAIAGCILLAFCIFLFWGNPGQKILPANPVNQSVINPDIITRH